VSIINTNIRIFSLIAIVVLLLMISSYQLLMSSMQGQLQQELSSWNGRDFATASYSDWQTKQPMVDLFSSMALFDGHALHSSSRFYRLGAAIVASSDKSGETALKHQQTALALIRQSLSKQPVWTVAWLDLAYIRVSMGMLGDEFQLAYRRAYETGGAEEFVITGLTDIGFAAWPYLSTDNQSRFLKSLELAVVRDRKHVITLAEYYRRVYIICSLIPKQKSLKKYCKS
jgi:hypothetical protein